MTAIFILSLDTEIAWGTDKDQQPRYAACFDHYPTILRRLIDLLDTYQIPATWAVVGHLLLQPGDPRGLPGLTPESWYYAPYILDWLRAARTPHEIGTHTFSHIYTNDPAITREAWEQELYRCVELSREHGLTMRSLVYPRNQIAYLDTLPKQGIVAYRGVEGNRSVERRGLLHLLDRALAVPPPTYDFATLKFNDQLVNLPASQFLLAYDGIRRWIPTASRVRQARLGIEKAIRLNQLYHLWFHPFNLGTSPLMFDALEQILRLASEHRDAGTLRIMTMDQAADWVLGGASHD